MKTDELITMLARHHEPVKPLRPTPRLTGVLLVGLALSAVLAAVLIRHFSISLYQLPLWWLKFAYAAALGVAGLWAATRLSRPALRAVGARRLAWLLIAGLALLALFDPTLPESSSSAERMAAWMGHSWRACPVSIVALSLPVLALALWVLRQMAPTDLRRAGASAGLLAGGVAAAGYAVACNELSPAFVVTWYTLGVAAVTALGALLGPWVLRW
jgi:hypothetical protein